MIQFTKVRFKNLGSFGNYFTEIEFDKNKSTLVSGSNGHGKSFALLDSITFALFGKPFRKINIPQLINSINDKDCVVEVFFNIGNDSYLVRRGLKPKIFEIYKNDQLLNQSAKSKDYQKVLEEQILKMNYKSFTQVVILGSSSFVPFMQLPAAERRSIIEDILDINIFTTMNTILKTKLSGAKETLRELTYQSDLLTEKVSLQQNYISKLETQSKDLIDKNIKEIEEMKDIQDDYMKMISETKEFIGEIQSKHVSEPDARKKLSKLETLTQQIKSNIKKIQDEIGFFDKSNCPTCMQQIDKTKQEIQDHICAKNEKRGEYEKALLEISELMEKQMKELEQAKLVSIEVYRLQEEISRYNGKIQSCNDYISKLNAQITQLSTENKEKDQEQIKLQDLNTKLSAVEADKKDLVEDLHLYDIASILLKDSGIKAKIIKHYLPIMNKLINKYLSDMDFFANFVLDEEFNETIKSRYRDTFSYMSFSEGEKLRIDLALLLAWREIARIKNSANTNILILDEVFDSSLDVGGTEEFMKLLKTLSNNTHVIVISHKADQLTEKFERTISFEKQNNFSKMVIN
jgi:DNA repair exonuclease SbcCD ATPase subunit